MASPRIFVSSTYYDLKHLRSSLENFIEHLGFEPVLSEKGNITYSPDVALDVSCYREASDVDIFVLIIGGRYGSETSEGKTKTKASSFYEKYNSITRKEYESAIKNNIPCYIFIESNVYAEYQTYLKNKSSKKILYAHVDSVNIFSLIEEILSQLKNNPVKTFERYSEIEEWLKSQWAGLFKELLNRMSAQEQILALSSQVMELSEVNKTLKTYLEAVVRKISPDQAASLIKEEHLRLDKIRIKNEIESMGIGGFFLRKLEMPFDSFVELVGVKKFSTFIEKTKTLVEKYSGKNKQNLIETIEKWENKDVLKIILRDLNLVRKLLNVSTLPEKD